MASRFNGSVMSPFWLCAWAILMAITWLVPHHYKPWTAFHTDLWVAGATALGAFALSFRSRGPTELHLLTCVVGVSILWPWVQYALGLLPFAGQAWMTSLYLLGLFGAMLVGAKWERTQSGQLPDALFFAILVACIFSVWLQLYTWLGRWDGDLMDIWTMGLKGDRAYANLGQPNQTATLLLWGLAACLWFHRRRYLGGWAATAIAAYLCIGLALAQSRTAMLTMVVVLVAAWLWRPMRQDRRLSWVVSGLCIFHVTCLYLRGPIWEALFGGALGSASRLEQMDGVRLGAWNMLVHAVLERPWWGFGWTSVASAQMRVVDQFPGVGMVFAQAHNLLLELILGNGIPIGVCLGVVLLYWYIQTARAIRGTADAAIFLLLTATCIHALLELPLHYAYFLLPVGMFIGVLNVRTDRPVVFHMARPLTWAVLLLGIAGLLITARDYVQVESSTNLFRYELARIGTLSAQPPDVWVLTDQREIFDLAKLASKDQIGEQELARLEKGAMQFPSSYLSYRTAFAMRLHGREVDARRWMERACKITSASNCSLFKNALIELGQKPARTSSTSWPKE